MQSVTVKVIDDGSGKSAVYAFERDGGPADYAIAQDAVDGSSSSNQRFFYSGPGRKHGDTQLFVEPGKAYRAWMFEVAPDGGMGARTPVSNELTFTA